MRKKILVLFVTLFLILSLTALLNMKVTTYQGVNYKVSSMQLPLYLKILSFYDRHFNHKWLTKRITSGLEAKEDKIFRLFQWVHENIQRQPNLLPIMDDHTWNVYIRGYGVADNFHDLFSTLSNYVGVNAFFKELEINDSESGIRISFVQLKKGWVLFDPYEGVYFKNKTGSWATVKEIKKGDWEMAALAKVKISGSYYKPYFNSLSDIGPVEFGRANSQSPMNRILLQFDRWLYKDEPLLQ